MTREESIKLVKEVTGMSLDWDDAHYDALQMAIKALEQKWIPCDVRIPRQNEFVDNVRKCYLIQDEYGDMYVASYTNTGWIPINGLLTLNEEVIAWQPLPERYKVGD